MRHESDPAKYHKSKPPQRGGGEEGEKENILVDTGSESVNEGHCRGLNEI